MRNKLIILCCSLALFSTELIAETKPNCEQTVTGDKANAVCAGGDVTINHGLTKKQYEKMLKEQEERLIKRLQSANTSPDNDKNKNEKHKLLEIELNAVQEKLANVEQSYQEEKKKRLAADKALQQFKDQLPKAQIEKARANLEKGNTEAAEQAFDEIVNKGSGAIALAAFQSAQLAESHVDYAKAMQQYKKAVALEENNPEYLLVAGQMARTVADYAQAQEWFEHLLAIRQAENNENIDLANVQHALAYLYYEQGKYGAAEPLYQRAIKIYEKPLGKEHPSVATTLNNLAELYRVQGKYEAAEPLYQRSLTIRESVLGKEHPKVAILLNNLALLYKSQGKYEAEEPLYQRALTINENALGKEHPLVAIILNNLAGLYDSQGKYEAAEPLYLRALAILKATFPTGHPNIDVTQENYDYLKSKMK